METGGKIISADYWSLLKDFQNFTDQISRTSIKCFYLETG